MPSNNEQFEHVRLPIRVLPYKNRDLSICNELLIDYGENGNYHIYITHHNDDTKYIDITSKIINEMLPDIDINGDQFTITIEGIKDPKNLTEIINYIYKRFTYANDPSGFNPERDKDLITSPDAKDILLQTTDGTIILPITKADNVYDKYGNSIQDRLDNMYKVSFNVSYIYAMSNNQSSFEFSYPFENYSDFLEVRIGTTYIDKTRYNITKHYDADNNFKTGTIEFIGENIEIGRRIDLIWIFNTVIDNGKEGSMSGTNIVDSSISIDKLEQYSNSYTFPSSNSVATSKAVNDVYTTLSEAISVNNNNIIMTNDKSTTNNDIYIVVNNPINNKIVYITMASDKILTTSLTVGIDSGALSIDKYQIVTPDGKSLIKGFRNNQVVKFKLEKNKAIVLNAPNSNINTAKYIYSCLDQETVISYSKLNYYTGDVIHVYRNGVRLFQDLDYSMNTANETITLYVRTEEGERIVFESIGY